MSMIAVGTIYPLVFVLNVSLKDKRSYILDRFGVTDTFHRANFGDAWRRNLSRYMINSTIVTVGSVAVLLLLGSLAGYAFAQLSFKISNWAYLACLGALMIPFQVIMVPFVRMMLDIGFTNTYWGSSVHVDLPAVHGVSHGELLSAHPAHHHRGGNHRRGVGVGHVPADHPADRQASAVIGRNSQRVVHLERRARLAPRDAAGGETYIDDRRVGTARSVFVERPGLRRRVLIAAFPVIIVYIVFQRQIAAGVTAGAVKGDDGHRLAGRRRRRLAHDAVMFAHRGGRFVGIASDDGVIDPVVGEVGRLDLGAPACRCTSANRAPCPGCSQRWPDRTGRRQCGGWRRNSRSLRLYSSGCPIRDSSAWNERASVAAVSG